MVFKNFRAFGHGNIRCFCSKNDQKASENRFRMLFGYFSSKNTEYYHVQTLEIFWKTCFFEKIFFMGTTNCINMLQTKYCFLTLKSGMRKNSHTIFWIFFSGTYRKSAIWTAFERIHWAELSNGSRIFENFRKSPKSKSRYLQNYFDFFKKN